MCKCAERWRGTRDRRIDAAHEGLLMPEIPHIRELIAEALRGLAYAIGGKLEPSVCSQIEVTDRDLHGELFQNLIGLRIRGRDCGRYGGKQDDGGCCAEKRPRPASKRSVPTRAHVTSPLVRRCARRALGEKTLLLRSNVGNRDFLRLPFRKSARAMWPLTV